MEPGRLARSIGASSLPVVDRRVAMLGVVAVVGFLGLMSVIIWAARPGSKPVGNTVAAVRGTSDHGRTIRCDLLSEPLGAEVYREADGARLGKTRGAMSSRGPRAGWCCS